jgi:hypothetical protein
VDWIHLTVAGSCEDGFIKGGEFLDQLSNFQLIKKDFGPWS